MSVQAIVAGSKEYRSSRSFESAGENPGLADDSKFKVVGFFAISLEIERPVLIVFSNQ
jgi:hypothetical protein